LSFASPASAADDPATTAALDLYKAGKYGPALAQFETILKKKPNDAVTHYYMALCLHGMNQVARASSEYQLTIKNTRNPKLKEMAENGQESLNRYSSNRTKPASSPAPTAADTKTAEKKDEKTDAKTDGKTASGKTDGKDAKGKDGKSTDPKTAAAGAGKVKKVLCFMSWDRMSLAFEPTFDNTKQRLSGKVDVQKIDPESAEGAALKEKYGVGGSYPYMVYLDDKGKALASDSGDDIEGQVERLNKK
jgi:hypothetical protein